MSKPKGPTLEFFPESRIALGRELHHHPKLLLEIRMAGIPNDDYPELLGVVAAHFNVVLDGMYTPDSLDKLAEQLLFKLRGKRMGFVTPVIGKEES